MLNRELAAQFGDAQADFDGDDYEFHMTVAIGPCDAGRLPQLKADMADWDLMDRTQVVDLAMYVYEESTRPDSLLGVREYGIYKKLPLANHVGQQ